MSRIPTPPPAPPGPWVPIRVRNVEDYLKLVGKKVCVNEQVGVVKDLSDTGEHLVLLKESSVHEELTIRLDTIDLIEVLDTDPNLTHLLKLNRDRRSLRRRSRKPATPSPPSLPALLRVMYDETADSLYIRLSPNQSSANKQVMPDITLDHDAQGRPVGIEVGEATKHFGYGKPVLANLRFKLDFSEQTDCLSLVLPGTAKEKSIDGEEGVKFDYDHGGRLARITIAAASSRLDLARLGVRLA